MASAIPNWAMFSQYECILLTYTPKLLSVTSTEVCNLGRTSNISVRFNQKSLKVISGTPQKSNSTSARKQILKIAPAQRWVLFWLGTITTGISWYYAPETLRAGFSFFFPAWHRQNSSTDSRYFLLNKVELTDGRSVRVQTQKPSQDPDKKKRSTECEETLTHNTPTKQEEHTDLNASGGVNKEQVELMRVTRVKGSIERTQEGKETL